MNLANKLTLMRVILVPFFVAFMLIDAIPLNYLWALLVFAIASITDMLDGKIARKYNMITSFGKFLDPLADKILVAAALVCFVQLGWCSAWVTAPCGGFQREEDSYRGGNARKAQDRNDDGGYLRDTFYVDPGAVRRDFPGGIPDTDHQRRSDVHCGGADSGFRREVPV